MFDRIKQWNDRTREQARERRDAAGTRLSGMSQRVAGPQIDGVAAKQWVREHRQLLVDECAGVRLYPDRIVVLSSIEHPDAPFGVAPLAGASAELGTSGGVSGRATLTRAATVGGGWQKKVDTREAWLSVEGPGFAWVVPVSPERQPEARAFAAKLSAMGRSAADR